MMPSEKERYIIFAATTSALPLCFQPWYLDQVCEGGKWDVVLLEKDNTIVGVWPFFIKKKWGLRYITMPILTKWMGPWLVPKIDRTPAEEITLLEALAEKLPRVDFLTVACHPDIQNIKALEVLGIHATRWYTYRLTKEKDTWEASFNDNVKRDLRKADKELTISEEGSLELFCDIHEKTYVRQGIPCPVPREFLLRHLKSLQAQKAVRLTFARDRNGRVHSVLALTWDHRSAYYHVAGNDHSVGQLGGSKLLVRDAMAYTSEMLGRNTFDFEGSMIENVAQVWRRFGAMPVVYYRMQYFRFRWYEMVYRILRK